MPRQTKEQNLADIHAFALEEFDKIQSAERETREQCLEDRRFYSIPGAQWEGALADQFENMPTFEVNLIHHAVLRVVNEYRNNRITVDFTSRDGAASDKMADTCDGLYRADEKASNAKVAYDAAFEEGAAGGMGAWRLTNCYEDDYDDDNDQQRVAIEPIYDAESRVFFDPGCLRPDKADAKRGYLLTPYSHADYKDEFGDDPSSWSKDITRSEFDWCTPDVVWVCEHYVIEEGREWVYWFRGLALRDDEDNLKKVTESEIEEDPDLLDQLKATGWEEVRRKRVKRRQVHKYLLSGSKVLEDCGVIAGEHIPIVVTYGKFWVVDGIVRCMGHVRLAKDAQRLVNMLMSWLAEIAARFDVEKPIFTGEQMAGHAQRWAEDNVKKYPYLTINSVLSPSGETVAAGPVGYTKAPNVPPAMAALFEIALACLKELLGNQQDGEKIQPNISGKVVELIQQRLDMQTYIYMDNFAQAMQRCGEIWLSMKRAITVETGRRMKTVGSDGKASSAVVNEPRVDKDGATYLENDLSKATFDVDVDVGPTSSSKRAGTVRALSTLVGLTGDDPEMKSAILATLLTNIEGEGMSDLNSYGRRRGLKLGVIKPTDEEAQQLAAEQQGQQPDPQTQYLQAESQKAAAQTELALANTEKTRAQTAQTLAEIDSERQGQAIEAAEALQRAVSPPGGIQTS